jgi:putative ABC transport system permease protein
VAEIALALVLLVGAGLLLRSFLQLRRVDPGFQTANILTFRTGFPMAMVGQDQDKVRRFFTDLQARLAALPGVRAVALASMVPGRDGDASAIVIEGQDPPVRIADAPLARSRVTTRSYFAAVDVPLLAGRLFEDVAAKDGRTPKAMVDGAFAEKHFGSVTAAVGRRFRFWLEKEQKIEWIEIVGVVGSVRHRLERDEWYPTVYLPYAQSGNNFMTVLLRTETDASGYVAAARTAVLAVDRQIPIYHELTLGQVLLRGIWTHRFFGYLFTVFGLVALFLAAIGIYGVMAYAVIQRTSEIGVRMALGAQSGDVIRMVVRHGLHLVGAGLALGFVIAYSLAHLLQAFLYGVSPHDPPTFATVPALLAAVALLACYLPSRRATRIAPVVALRAE